MHRDRKRPRHPHHDYTQPGLYFVTACTQNREQYFGNVTNNEMILNGAGTMIKKWWQKIPEKFPKIILDKYVIMPNHIHSIIEIVGTDPCVCPRQNCGCTQRRSNCGRTHGCTPTGLPQIMQWFKTMTTNEYIHGVKNNQWNYFNGKLWQRSYHDRIIRNDRELRRIQEYIMINPSQWTIDDNYVV